MSFGDFSQIKIDPDLARQNTGCLIDPNRWYIVYLKYFLKKVQLKKIDAYAACACICRLSYGINIFSRNEIDLDLHGFHSSVICLWHGHLSEAFAHVR